jgi:hypothetical protein
MLKASNHIELYKFIISINDQGITRQYKAVNQYDALTLFHALTAKFNEVYLFDIEDGYKTIQRFKLDQGE